VEDRLASLEKQLAGLLAKYQAGVQLSPPPPSLQPPPPLPPPPPPPLLPPSPPPILVRENVVIPNFNPVEWKDFRALHFQDLEYVDTYAIDILVGEPTISDYDPLLMLGQESGVPPAVVKPKKSLLACTQYDGPLPERIRINSVPLIQLLNRVHSRTISIRDGPVLLFRPYRGLVFYEEELKSWYKRMERHWGQPARGERSQADETPASEPSPENTPPENEASNLERIPSPSVISDDNSSYSSRSSFPDFCEDSDAVKDARLLMSFINHNIKAQMAHVNSESCQKIAFLDLWYIFKPGNEVISSARDQLYRVNRVIGALHNPSYPDHDDGFWAQPSVFQVECLHMDYNGKIFGPVTEIFDIEKYRGERDITSLRIYPVRYSKDPAQVRQALLDRGRMFMDVARMKHMHYKGITISDQEEVDGQVIIDFEQCLLHKPEWKPSITEDKDDKDEDDKDVRITSRSRRSDRRSASYMSLTDYGPRDAHCGMELCCGGEIIFNDNFVDAKMKVSFFEKNPLAVAYTRARTVTAEGPNVRDEELVLLTKRVFGFILTSRKWGMLLLSLLDKSF
jgi:hypothetical protein